MSSSIVENTQVRFWLSVKKSCLSCGSGLKLIGSFSVVGF